MRCAAVLLFLLSQTVAVLRQTEIAKGSTYCAENKTLSAVVPADVCGAGVGSGGVGDAPPLITLSAAFRIRWLHVPKTGTRTTPARQSPGVDRIELSPP
jgi:hypothetical protein